jgi:hypothetical protein
VTHDERDDRLGHAPYEERIRPVVLFTIWLAVGTVAVLGLMKLTHDAFARQVRRESTPLPPLAAIPEEPPLPRLQALPSLDLRKFREREDERLSTYGWIDRRAGVVHVPIERAMELVSKEGFPVRKEVPR